MSTETAICPVGDHEFTYEVKRGKRRTYCSVKHQNRAAADKQRERNENLAERWCSRGKHMQPADAFSMITAPYCRPCTASWARERRQKETSEQARTRQRKETLRRYNLTPESFAAKLAGQGGCCAICRTSDPGLSGWHVDHDHACCKRAKSSCGKCLRDILCTNCNKGIGCLQEDPATIQAAHDYVVRWQAKMELLAEQLQ